MAAQTILIFIAAAAVMAAAWLFLPHFDPAELSMIRGDIEPQEPCWTEEIGSDGRYSYSRGQCFNAELKDLEARARLGEFDTPA